MEQQSDYIILISYLFGMLHCPEARMLSNGAIVAAGENFCAVVIYSTVVNICSL